MALRRPLRGLVTSSLPRPLRGAVQPQRGPPALSHLRQNGESLAKGSALRERAPGDPDEPRPAQLQTASPRSTGTHRRGSSAQLPRFHADGRDGESRGPGRPPIRRQRPTPGTPRDVTHPALEVPPSGRAWEKPRRASRWGLSKGENNSLVNRARYSYPEKYTGR